MGTTLASLGLFLPLNVGFANIDENVPVFLQGAILSSSIFHFMVNDDIGPIGMTLRAMWGSYSKNEVKAFLAICWILTTCGQVRNYLYIPFLYLNLNDYISML